MLHSVSQDVNYVYNFIYLINEHHIAELALKKILYMILLGTRKQKRSNPIVMVVGVKFWRVK